MHFLPWRVLPCTRHHDGNAVGLRKGGELLQQTDFLSLLKEIGLDHEVTEKEMNGGKNYKTSDRLTL